MTRIKTTVLGSLAALALALGVAQTVKATVQNSGSITVTVVPSASPGTATPPPSLSYDLTTSEGAISFWSASASAGGSTIIDDIPNTALNPDTLNISSGISLGYSPGPIAASSGTTGASCSGNPNAESSTNQNAPSSDFTLGVSLRPLASASSQGPLFSISSGSQYIGFWTGNDRKIVGAIANDGISNVFLQSSSVPSTTAWSRANLRYSSETNTATLFVNGVNVAQVGTSGTLGNFVSGWQICHAAAYPSGATDPAYQLYYQGEIADMDYVGAAVSDANIATEYKSITASSTSDPTPPPVVAVASPTAHPAIAAANILDSIGEDSHYNYEYPADTHPQPFMNAALHSGFHHLRDAWQTNFSVGGVTPYTTLCDNGVKFIFGFNVFESGNSGTKLTQADVVNRLNALSPHDLACIDHVEGQNEFNSSGVSDWAADLGQEAQTIWNAMRTGSNAAKFANIAIYAAPLNGSGDYADMTPAKLGFNWGDYVDYGNAHVGFAANDPEDNSSHQYSPNAIESVYVSQIRVAFPPDSVHPNGAPLVTTEFPAEGDGIGNTGRQSSQNYIPERIGAKYIPRGFLYYLAHGFSRVYFYLDSNEPSDDTFGGEGLLDQNGNGKYQYYSMTNLLKVLNSQNPTPNYQLAAAPLYFGLAKGTGSNPSLTNLQIVPIAQPNGDYDILYWLGAESWNTETDAVNCPGGNHTTKNGNCAIDTVGLYPAAASTTITVPPQSFIIGDLPIKFDHAVNYTNTEQCNAAPAWHDLAFGQPEPTYATPVNTFCYPYVPTAATISGQSVSLNATDMVQDLHISANQFTPVSSAAQAPMAPAPPLATPAGSSSLATYSPWPLATPTPGPTPVEVTSSS